MVTLGMALLVATATSVASTGACTIPNTPAAIRSLPLTPSSLAAATDDHGATELIVTLTPASAPATEVALSRSSGSSILDAASIRMARQAQFEPEMQNCTPVGGQYFVVFEY